MSDGKLLELGRCEEPSYGVPYEGVLHDASGCNSGVECLLPKQDVVGSNPITRSNQSIQAVTPKPFYTCFDHSVRRHYMLATSGSGTHWDPRDQRLTGCLVSSLRVLL